MGKDDAADEVRIVLPQKKIAIKRANEKIQVTVTPFPLETLLPKLAGILEKRKDAAAIDWQELDLESLLANSLDACCDLSAAEIRNLTSGEKMGILKAAIFELDPELPKNLVGLANEVLGMIGGINI